MKKFLLFLLFNFLISAITFSQPLCPGQYRSNQGGGSGCNQAPAGSHFTSAITLFFPVSFSNLTDAPEITDVYSGAGYTVSSGYTYVKKGFSNNNAKDQVVYCVYSPNGGSDNFFNSPNAILKFTLGYSGQIVTSQDCLVGQSPLPVSFKSFNAARNQTKVALSWITSSESNNKGFNVQRNTKGVWETVAFVFSAADGGNSSSDLSYAYNDANSNKSVSQYRIQQVDLDGQAKYSEIRSVRGEEMSSRLLVFPNPSNSGNVNLVFQDQSLKNISVSDMSGRVVRVLKNVSNSASIEGLENGVYSIQVTDLSSAARSVEKVIIKKR